MFNKDKKGQSVLGAIAGGVFAILVFLIIVSLLNLYEFDSDECYQEIAIEQCNMVDATLSTLVTSWSNKFECAKDCWGRFVLS